MTNSSQPTSGGSDASRTVQAYIDASGALDTAALQECFAAGAALHGYLGETLVAGDIGIYLADVERMAAAGADMSAYVAEIARCETTGDVASATVSMSGFAGAAFTDMLHLVRSRGEWRIVAKTFTTMPALAGAPAAPNDVPARPSP